MIFWELTVVLLLILVNGFFAMSEMAIVSSRRARLAQRAEAGARGAQTALALMQDPGRFLSTVQVGITLVGVFAGAYGGSTLAEPLATVLAGFAPLAGYAEPLAFGLVVMAISYFTLILGELVPKRLALSNAEAIAQVVAVPMRALASGAKPLVALLSISTEAVLRLLRLHGPNEEQVTEEEVKALIEEGTRTGVFDPAEQEMIDGVLRLADRPVRAIMTPRREVVWLDVTDDPDSVRRQIIESRFSRFPVAREQLEEFLGVVDTKELLDRLLAGKSFDLAACLRRPLVVHETTRVMRLLDMFRGAPLQMAVVVDEYGSLQGIVTLTDVVASVAGEVGEPGAEEPELTRRADGSWLVGGAVLVEEVERAIGLKGLGGGGDYHTLAGFVLDRLQHVPKVTDGFDWNGWRFEVVDMDGARVDKVLVSRVG